MRIVVVGAIVLVVAVLAVRVLTASDDDNGHDVGRVGHFTVDSREVSRPLRVTTVVPPGASADDKRPLLVFLHGRQAHEDAHLGAELSRALARLGDRAPVIVFPYGGETSYWHDRDDGDWADYVMNEVLPRATSSLPVDPDRVAIGGISMGGFGALDIARAHPGRFCAVGAHSPALFEHAGESSPGAFDDAEDFARHDVIGSARRDPGQFGHQPVWLDVGTSDRFVTGVDALAAALGSGDVAVSVQRWPGEHDADYWSSHYDEYLDFYARACADPAPTR